MTNIFLISIVLTNWQTIDDWKRESGTNYIRQRQVVYTNTFAVEVRTCYTSNLVHQAASTNGPTRWLPVGVNAVPPLPGVFTKP